MKDRCVLKRCTIEGCEERHKARGLCTKHYEQWKNHGKVLNRTRFTPNEFIIEGDICKINLYDRKGNFKAQAIIDAEDYEKVKDHKWCFNDYVQTHVSNKIIRIQHVILEIESNRKIQIDHWDQDTLNNRKKNLRKCSHEQNLVNQSIYKNNTHGYKGVYWDSRRNKWYVQANFQNKTYSLGSFTDKIEAAKAYDKFALGHFGEFAVLNFPIKENNNGSSS